MYQGVEAWVTFMYHPQGSGLDSDDFDSISGVISKGFGKITWLWKLFNEMLDNDDPEKHDTFLESLQVAGQCGEESFFRKDSKQSWEYDGLDSAVRGCIVDEGHERLKRWIRNADELAVKRPLK
ncbi:hypothetical protein B0H16DRAFT_1681589 [Mycena metata]|uniref:Uncharacterized protein n=1 Tax=Mycena metata TaxID=1033252 RepID=A0AAD7KJZ1_9AGAR|nr:hypothetical protein B0H16DRAFT_1681589 [Mycena metata]